MFATMCIRKYVYHCIVSIDESNGLYEKLEFEVFRFFNPLFVDEMKIVERRSF